MDNKFENKLSQTLSEFQKKDFLTDIQIKLRDGSAKVHKLVLAAKSEFFKMLFSNASCREVTTGVVDLPCIDCEVFAYILDYMYGRVDERHLSREVPFFVDVVVASDYLGMLDLIKKVDSHLGKSFHEDYLTLFEKLLCYNLRKTVRKCEQSVIDFIKRDNYSVIMKMPVDTLVRLIEDDGFAIEENVLCKFLSMFVMEHDTKDCKRLFDNVRVSLLEEDLLNELRRSEIGKTLEIKMSDIPRGVPFLYVVNNTGGFIVSMDRFDINDFVVASKTVIVKSPCHDICRFFGHRLIMTKSHIKWNDSPGNFVDLSNGRIFTIPPIECPLPGVDSYLQFGGFSTVLMNVHLFVMGGFHFTHDGLTVPSKNVLRFDVCTSDWSAEDDLCLREACWSHAVALSTEQPHLVYVSGGRTHDRYLSSFYCVDFVTKTVVDLPSLPVEIYGHRMESVNGAVVIFDGNHKHDVFLFSLRDNIWRVLDLSVAGVNLHLSYCCATENTSCLTFYELTRDVCKDRVTIYSRRVDLNSLDRVCEFPPTSISLLVDKSANEIHVGMGVYSSDFVVLTSSEDFLLLCDVDSD